MRQNSITLSLEPIRDPNPSTPEFRRTMAETKAENHSPKGEEDEKLAAEAMAVLDFDLLCAAVARQTQGIFSEKAGNEEANRVGFGGVQRMWEGGVLDCLEDQRIAIESAW